MVGEIVLEHGIHLLTDGFLDLGQIRLIGLRIGDHQVGQVVIVFLYDAVLDDLGDVVHDTGNVAPLCNGAVLMTDHVVVTAMDPLDEAEAFTEIGIHAVAGDIVDQGQFCLPQRSDDCGTGHGRLFEILVINVDNMCIAVDLVILLAGNVDNTGAYLSHTIGIDQAGTINFLQQYTGGIIHHLTERRIEFGLVEVYIVLLDIKSDTDQQILMVIQVIRLVGVDLVDQCLGFDTFLNGIGHVFTAQDTELLNGRIGFLDRSVQGVGTAHGLSKERVVARKAHDAQPVGGCPGVIIGRDQGAQGAS